MNFFVMILSIFVLLTSSAAFSANTEYRIARIQTEMVMPNGTTRNVDTIHGSIYVKRSQVFITPGNIKMKSEICSVNYTPGCRTIFTDYDFIAVNGRNITIRDSYGKYHIATVMSESPLNVIFPGHVNIMFSQVAYTGVDRHPDITKKWTIREALTDISDKDNTYYFPSW